MLDVHGKDLTVKIAFCLNIHPTSYHDFFFGKQVSTEPSRAGTPTPAAAAAKSVSTPAAKTPAVKSANKALNTETVVVETTFMASADDLFDILTNEARIPMWTRNSAVVRTSFAAFQVCYFCYGFSNFLSRPSFCNSFAKVY
jgi:activator of HSP90 ATPase